MKQSIKELAGNLQKKIDERLAYFVRLGAKLKALNQEAEEIHKEMADVVSELEPVESLVYNQNPQLVPLFDELKRVYLKDDEDGFNTEANE